MVRAGREGGEDGKTIEAVHENLGSRVSRGLLHGFVCLTAVRSVV